MTESIERVLGRGELVQRYVVLDAIGHGAMGVVYRAYDPELDRKIAIKVLRIRGADVAGPPATGSDATQDDLGSRQLLREAQVLARLRHPNVVAVHDVGVAAGRVFLAMELVDGPTLAALIAGGDRTDMLSRILGAGAGLAAAHRAGLVHRDFKPSNVLFDEFGRARVADFGLARPYPVDASGPVARGRLEATATNGPVSQSNTPVGTPAYMAPEVRAGSSADLRADQFSFCATAVEALTGTRPGLGHNEPNATELLLRCRLPRPTRRGLLRGLSIDPQARFASMDALLQTLAPRSGRGLTVAISIGVVATAAAVVAGRPDAEDRCHQGQATWTAIWNEGRRATVSAALRPGTGSATWDVAAQVGRAIDRFGTAWVAAYDGVCSSTEPASVVAEQRGCLLQRRDETDALLDELSAGPFVPADRVDRALPSPTDLIRCTARSVSGGSSPPAPAGRESEVALVRSELARIDALERLGRFDRGLVVAQRTAIKADAIGHAPLQAEVDYRRGRLLQQLGREDDARQLLAQAHWAAEASRFDRLAADAATHLVFLLGARKTDTAAALEWAEHARASVARAGNDPAQHAELLNAVGSTLASAGRYGEARTRYEAAVQSKADVFGTESREVAQTRANLAIVLEELGDYAGAQAQLQWSLAQTEGELGPTHPAVAAVLTNLGAAQLRSDPAAALASYRRSMAIKESVFAGGHPSLVGVNVGIGAALRRLGRLDEAEEAQRAAVEHARAAFADSGPELATARHNLATVLRQRGALAEAAEVEAAAVEGWRSAYGAQHPHVADGLIALAEVESRLGRDEDAQAHARLALQTRTQVGPDDLRTCMVAGTLGWILERAGESDAARVALARAREIARRRDAIAQLDVHLASLHQGVQPRAPEGRR